IERNHVRVAHFLQVVCSERGAESSPAIEHQLRAFIRNRFLDVAFDHTLAEMYRAGRMRSLPLIFFTHIDELPGFARFAQPLIFVNIDFPYALLRMTYERKESRAVVFHRRAHAYCSRVIFAPTEESFSSICS